MNKNHNIYRHNGKRWTRYPGAANDIGVNSAGQVWIIGTNKEGGGYGIYRLVTKGNRNASNPRNVKWEKYAGSAVRISVGPDGNAWVANKSGRIYKSKGTKGWNRLSGRAKDIGVGENGQMWAIGTNKEGGGFGIYKYNAKTRKYKKVPGSGTDISVDKAGRPWIVNVKKNVYSHNGKRWTKQAFTANDIGVGADGTIHTIGTKVEGGGFAIYKTAAGPAKTIYATQSQGATNWKSTTKYSLSLTGRSFQIKGDNRVIWSSGNFKCADRLMMGDDGNLQSFCRKDNKPQWSMTIGSAGPKRLS